MNGPRHLAPRGSARLATMLTLAALVAALAAVGTLLLTATSMSNPTTVTSLASDALPRAASTKPVPVYAYFYQWFTPSSWNRAKQDFPLIGRYSSDDPAVLMTQVKQAKSAGIDGFLTSWKSTEPLNRRLDMLISTAKQQGLDLGVVYEALDFNRNPLPVATVEKDMTYLVDRWGRALTSTYYGRPVIIWTGTDQYTRDDVSQVRAALGTRAYLLAASRTVAGYERVADLVDGEAYYWSSADPQAPSTMAKLAAMADAVHARHGLWFAPAASGYDGRSLGGTRVIDRADGRTLSASLDNAYASQPDAVAVISWNEWSENTYIEPGETYGDRELTVLRDYLAARGRAVPASLAEADSSEGTTASGWTGSKAALTLGALMLLTFAWLAWRASHRRDDGGPADDAGGPDTGDPDTEQSPDPDSVESLHVG